MKKLLLQEITPLVPLEDEKYDNYINRIKQSRENKKYKTVYMEKHHIKPKSCGGINNKENLIWLLAQEHYYAHKLLAKENPKILPLIRAWWIMSNRASKRKRNCYITADEFAEIRKWHLDTFQRKTHPCSLPVVCLETKKEYSNCSEAAKDIGVKRSIIHMVCSHKEKNITAKGLHFLYKSEYNENKAKEILSLKEGIEKIKQAVYCVETGEIFESIVKAAESINRSEANIRAVLYGRIETCGKDKDGKGYHWRYLDESKNTKLRKAKPIKQVICLTSGKIFKNVHQAAQYYQINESTLRGNIKGHVRKCNVIIDGQKMEYQFAYYEKDGENNGSSTTLQ